MSESLANPEEDYEAQHVHEVYEHIASHFSSTRYKVGIPSLFTAPNSILTDCQTKPWPIVERFLKDLPDGSVGLDVGCGNGKYLAVNPKVFIVGSDRSTNLIRIAKQHPPHSVLVADALSLPHQSASFDFAISIAVVHHLSTPDRRVNAIRSILDMLKPGAGRSLIYVWALEQGTSRRGWTENDSQDVMVPWVTKTKTTTKGPSTGVGNGGECSQSAEQTFHRYYHLYRRGELEADIFAAGGRVEEAGYEKDNWWAIASKGSLC